MRSACCVRVGRPEEGLPRKWRDALAGLKPGQATSVGQGGTGYQAFLLLERTQPRVEGLVQVYPLVEKRLAEAKLCREAELCYQAMALVTDYDCWHQSEGPVTVEMIIGHLNANIALAKKILVRLPPALEKNPAACACGEALKNAIMTSPAAIPAETRRRLAPIIGKYIPA